MNYNIKTQDIAYQGYLKVLKAKLEFESFTSDKFISASREACHRGDSCSILLLEKETNKYIFTNQFRYPTTLHNDGWIVEIVAGNIEADEPPEQAAIREIEEEVGYQAKELKLLMNFYLSPGRSTERNFLFYAEVSVSDKTRPGGGVYGEEDIETIKLSKEELKAELDNGRITDAKTIIAVQRIFLNNL